MTADFSPISFFAHMAANPTLDKLCRFLNSVRGTDKVLMLAQYASKIIIWKLRKGNPDSMLSQRIANFAGPVSDFRILLRYYGLIPLTQWILYSEANPPPTQTLRILYRLQNLVNLAYYPLEHIWWLGSHKVIPISEKTLNSIGIWSCRFWAAYVVLYFFQLQQEASMLARRSKALLERAKKGEEKDVLKAERKIISDETNALIINTIINASYFPLTVHWSLETSSFPDVGVGICGTIAALCQTYAAWKSA
ncbi:peroxisomal biogenesis factor 11 [Chytridium lagenaria]|nr:peroxisomal biogenesis factor 11 [Chytridium lagenaria]